MKKTSLFCVMIILCLQVIGQSPHTRQLNIGDRVPDITISNLFNYTTDQAGLNDFRGKLVILDFWATWCGSCIKAMPKLDSLQRQFKDSLAIILLNEDIKSYAAKVNAYLDKQILKSNGSFSLISTIRRNDDLRLLFPHTFLPHYVWIDASGYVIAFTYSADVTAENIEAALSGNIPKMKIKLE